MPEPVNKEARKPTKKRDMKKQEKELLEEEKEPRAHTDFITNSVRQKKIKNMIPGFSIIKNRIITPLLIASERVVEYMIPEQASADMPESEQQETVSEPDREHALMNARMDKLSLEDIERRQRK